MDILCTRMTRQDRQVLDCRKTIPFLFPFLLILFRLEKIRVNLLPRFTRRHCLVASHSLGATGAAHTADKIVVTWNRSTGA